VIGRVLDRYRIESKLGEGGMGVVYKARDIRLDRSVAIKVLPPDKIADPTRKQRFAQEARAASALNHSGIVTIHDICSHEGIDFIVMEYVGGRTLDEVIASKGLRPAQALRYAVEIADALAKAHEAGIIHRDVKPSNLMVTDDGHVKVLDFGLAKLIDPPDASAETATRASPMTEEGSVLGTVAYMSPEQAEGRKLDARSDIFSFGSVLYEMVTGRKPFAGDSRAAIQAKILNDDPEPPGRIAQSIPPDLEKAILRCLRKDMARRYQTMADLKVVLEDIAADLSSGSGSTSPVAAASRSRAWMWAAIAAVATGVAYVGWQATRTDEAATVLQAMPIVSLPGGTRSPSFSPDGGQITFSWTGSDGTNTDIYVQQIGVGSPVRRTTDPRGDFSPAWSPDGKSIAYFRGDGRGNSPHEVRLLPPLGGADRTVTEIRPSGFRRPLTLDWCPDSTCLVLTDSPGEGRPDALYVVSVETGEKRQLTSPGASMFADSNPAVSPDGRWLVFRRESGPFTGELLLLPLGPGLTASGEPRALTPATFPAFNPRWMPDSTEIVFSADAALWRLRIGGDGKPQRLPFVGEDGQTPVVSRSTADRPSRLAYIRSYSDVNIWRVETPGAGAPATSPPALAIASTRLDSVPHYRSDGARVTFQSTRSGESEVWTADITGANEVRITSMRVGSGWPHWSPDGKQIAFHSNPESNAEIFVVGAEGGKPTNLSKHPDLDVFPSFSRDGRWVYFTRKRDGQEATVWKVPAAGGPAVQISERTGAWAIESHDGVYFVGSFDSSIPATLWRVPIAGGAAVKITEGVSGGSFDVVDGGVYYIEWAAGESRLQYFDLLSGKTITVAGKLGNVPLTSGLTVSRDGRLILFSRIDSALNDLMLVENFR
jgi:serine/threonine protein kinase